MLLREVVVSELVIRHASFTDRADVEGAHLGARDLPVSRLPQLVLLDLPLLGGGEEVAVPCLRAVIDAGAIRLDTPEHRDDAALGRVGERIGPGIDHPDLHTQRIGRPAAGQRQVHRLAVEREIVENIHVVRQRTVGHELTNAAVQVVDHQTASLIRAEHEALLRVGRMHPNRRRIRRITGVRDRLSLDAGHWPNGSGPGRGGSGNLDDGDRPGKARQRSDEYEPRAERWVENRARASHGGRLPYWSCIGSPGGRGPISLVDRLSD